MARELNLVVMGLGLSVASLGLLAASLGAAGDGPVHPADISWVPLAKASTGSGETLFEKLEADRTGVDFTFYWDPPEKYMMFFDGTLGGGVALGDYDSDGRVDRYRMIPAFGHFCRESAAVHGMAVFMILRRSRSGFLITKRALGGE